MIPFSHQQAKCYRRGALDKSEFGWKALITLATFLAIVTGLISDRLFELWNSLSSLPQAAVDADIEVAAILAIIACVLSVAAVFLAVWLLSSKQRERA